MYTQQTILHCPNHHQNAFAGQAVFCNVCGERLIWACRQISGKGQEANRTPRRYTAKQLRWVGLGLMLGAFVFLLLPAISPEVGVLGLFLFLACFVSGVMLLRGFFGESAVVAGMRDAAAAQGRQNRRQSFNIAPREFRYKTGWIAYSLLIVLFMGFFLAGILFLAVGVVNPNVRLVLLCMGLFLSAFGGSGLLYVYRISQMNIRADSWGLKAVTLFGYVEIAWNEILTLEGFDIRSLTYGSWGEIYRVYSLHKTLEFSQKLEGYQELISLINAATQGNEAAYQRN